MADGEVPEGYDGTAGRTKTTAKQSVSAGCGIWTVTETIADRDGLLRGF